MPRVPALPPAARTAVMSAALVCILAGLAGAAACSFIITDNSPPFACLPDQNNVCPGGQVCVRADGGAAGRCMVACTATSCPSGFQCDTTGGGCAPVTDGTLADGGGSDDTTTSDVMADAYVDAPADADASVATDARAEADVILTTDATGDGEGGIGNDACANGAIGCECTPTATNSVCEVGAFCADWQAVTVPLSTDAGADAGDGGGLRLCTKPCCTSSDCYKGSVCFGTGAGGNYCVPPSMLNDRTATGPLAGNGGQPCDAGSSCRSGLCSPLSGTCEDTCCTAPQGRMLNSQCAAGTSCRVGPFQGSGIDSNYVPRCAPAMGMRGNGEPCTGNSDCRSNLCVNDPVQGLTCRDPCRRPEDCAGPGQSQTCQYLQLSGTGATTSGNVVAACVSLSQPGAGDGGALDLHPCKTSSDCAKGYCAQTAAGPSVCVAVCFTDGDCISIEMCRPQMLQVAGTVYSVLACK